MNSYFNQADFNPGGKYGPDAEAMQDRIDQASPFNIANPPYSQNSFSDDKWKDALSKGISWLSGTGRSKYTSQAQRQSQQSFMPQSGGGSTAGGSWQQIAPGTSVWTPPPTPPFTVAGGQSSGGGLGSTIGAAAGLAAGMFIPGAQPFTKELMALGGGIGGQIG